MALAGPCASTVRAMISKLVSRKDHGKATDSSGLILIKKKLGILE